MKHVFEALIYKTGINWAVDVSAEITGKLKAEKGYIRIKGRINGFEFRKSLVPVKSGPYRLFVNLLMMKGGKTALGQVAEFEIEQDNDPVLRIEQRMHPVLIEYLDKHNLNAEFNNLTNSRKKDILAYLHSLKYPETLKKNIEKVIRQLKDKVQDTRIP